ncbi:hypothetical protein D5S17_30880 [Pseudonocardiaceae bacterium YIM PH 21723]|nr:hypothetical protein D5S17_30880 [Pseudonocardiaceae bacterium YIM PH 21723]
MADNKPYSVDPLALVFGLIALLVGGLAILGRTQDVVFEARWLAVGALGLVGVLVIVNAVRGRERKAEPVDQTAEHEDETEKI